MRILPLRLAAAVCLWVFAPAAAFADTAADTVSVAQPGIAPKISTEVFAARSPFGSPRLSPEGNRVAMRLTINGTHIVIAQDIDSGDILYRLALDEDNELEWFRWAGNNRILVSLASMTKIYGEEVRVTRLYAIDLELAQMVYIGPKRQGIEGDDVLFIDLAGEYVLLSYQPDIFTVPEVWRFPLDGSGTDNDLRVLRGRENVWEWFADNKGVVRIGLGGSGSKLVVWYRRTEDENFKVIARLGQDAEREEYWNILRIVSGSDEGLMLEPGDSGRMALRRFNYATREVGEIIYENPDWDVSDFEIDEDGNPVAVYFTDDRDRVVWLDPEMKELQQDLERALKSEDVWINSRSRNDDRMIVWKGGASDPGVTYMYTPKKRELNQYVEARPGLHPSALAEVKPISYTARDGTRISGYLTLPMGVEPAGLPLIILPHGGPYGVRDKLEYNDEVQLLANRGYAVLQPNFRGSAGYGEEFSELGAGQLGRAMQDDLDDAMDWVVSEGIADAGRVCVVGSSYGGYAALWAVMRNPERYRCAASFAGVTDWNAQLKYDANFFSSKGNRAWRTRVRGDDRKFNLDTVSPARAQRPLTRPVLLAHGRKDKNVPYNQFTRLRSAFEKSKTDQVQYLIFDKAGHGFSTAEEEQLWYDSLMGFLDKHNPADDLRAPENGSTEK